MDILLELIRLLRPRATLFGAGFDAFGEWGLSFRKRGDYLFCWLERGECQLVRPFYAPLDLNKGDFVLIRTSTPFTLPSGGLVEPIDSETAVSVSKRNKLCLGSGEDRPVTVHAGKFVVETGNEGLLTGLLPQLIHVAADAPSLGRIRSLLDMNEMEAREPGPASEFIILRLVELVLVEIMRSHPWQGNEDNNGLLAGLADRVIERALVAMHKDVARNWTVSELAELSCVSRSKFATRFRKVIGSGPIEYLLQWRMALAKNELQAGIKSVSEIGFDIGFQSSSAFSSAFTREVGCPPSKFGRRGAI
jgi:AraC-like DNA-binding protein